LSIMHGPWLVALGTVVHLAVAFALALPMVWKREGATRLANLRTFPMVAISSCGYVYEARLFLGDDPEPNARVMQGLIGGIGFIGGGAILKARGQVHGTATAAAIWATGLIGAAVGHGQYPVAVAISLVTFVVFRRSATVCIPPSR
jgi:uncharacterized membrane protein YhiD involved in acid resistance